MSRIMSLCRVAATLLVGALLLAACGASEPVADSAASSESTERQSGAGTTQPLHVAFANFSDEHPFGAAVLSGVVESAEDDGNIELDTFDNENDSAKAVENARNIATLQPDIVLWYNAQADANEQVARIFEEADLDVIAIQVPLRDAPLYAVDNELAGAESGGALAEAAREAWSSETPEFLIVNVPEAGQLFIDRGNAAKQAIQDEYPDLDGSALNDFSSQNDPEVTRQIVTDFLSQHPNSKVAMWMHVDLVATAGLAAARAAGREDDVLISSTGGDESVFPEVRKPDSPLIGTFSFFPELWGDDLFPLARRLHDGEAIDDVIRPTTQVFLTADNIDEYVE